MQQRCSGKFEDGGRYSVLKVVESLCRRMCRAQIELPLGRTAALAAGALGQPRERRIRRRLHRCLERLEQVAALHTA